MKSCICLWRVLRSYALFVVIALIGLYGCSDKFNAEEGEGLLRLTFDNEYRLLTRTGLNLPDTCDFRLTVRQSDGRVIYDGRYGDSPEVMKVKAGSCYISVISSEFSEPGFDMPQFGDEQCIIVPSDGEVSARLVCRQINCGVRLKIDKAFLTECPNSVLFIKSVEGRLMYGYSERRTAYFPSGTVSLTMVTGEVEKNLLSRTLMPGDMLTIGVDVASQNGNTLDKSSGFTIVLDTARVWNEAFCTIGSGEPGESGGDSGGSSGSGTSYPEDVLTISQAKSMIGASGVWVSAYIVGGNLTSSSAKYDPPFSSNSNILIGPRSVIVDRTSGMSVQLSAGKIRDALNLVDNPELLGQKVLLKGDVAGSYFGLVGLKNVTDYKLL